MSRRNTRRAGGQALIGSRQPSAEFVQAARAKDYPMILGLTVALTVLVLLVNLIADVLMAIIDPRMREERT